MTGRTHRLQSTQRIEEWFDSKGRMDDEELCTPEEVAALRDFLVVKDHRKTLSTQEAALLLMHVPEGRDDMANPSAKAFRIADLVLDTDLEYEELQELSMDLMDTINNMTEPGQSHRVAEDAAVAHALDICWECCTDTFDKWNTLVSERFQSCWAWRYEPIEDEAAEEPKRHWAAINALFAKRRRRTFEQTLSQQPNSNITLTKEDDLRVIGLKQIREALEQQPWKRRPESLAQGASAKKWMEYELRSLDVELPPAARWLQITGLYVYMRIMQKEEQSRSAKNSPEETKKKVKEDAEELPDSDLWKVDDGRLGGLSLSRWKIWKDQLLWIMYVLSNEEVDLSTKKEATQALISMNNSEALWEQRTSGLS